MGHKQWLMGHGSDGSLGHGSLPICLLCYTGASNDVKLDLDYKLQTIRRWINTAVNVNIVNDGNNRLLADPGCVGGSLPISRTYYWKSARRCYLATVKSKKTLYRPGLHTGPHWENLQHSPRPLAGGEGLYNGPRATHPLYIDPGSATVLFRSFSSAIVLNGTPYNTSNTRN